MGVLQWIALHEPVQVRAVFVGVRQNDFLRGLRHFCEQALEGDGDVRLKVGDAPMRRVFPKGQVSIGDGHNAPLPNETRNSGTP